MPVPPRHPTAACQSCKHLAQTAANDGRCCPAVARSLWLYPVANATTRDAGKTTLVNLMMRFYELDAGRITLDGVDVTSVPRRELRSRLGMVLQDTWLFGGTIRDNIAYGRPTATEDEILEAARATYVDRFVHSLPEGYDTVLEDEGSNVSAGEKQLLTIARAFLAWPLVLNDHLSGTTLQPTVDVLSDFSDLLGIKCLFSI